MTNHIMLEALRDIEGIVEDQADVDDGIPNDAMRILVIVRAAIDAADEAEARACIAGATAIGI